MATQWFLITAVKPGKAWKDSYAAYQNYALAVRGIGNPIKLTLTEPVTKEPKAGDRVYGKLTEEPGPDSRIFYNLKLESPPADYLRQQDIHAQVGLKEALANYREGTYHTDLERSQAYDNIKTEAIHFAKLIEQIKEEL